MYKPLMPAPEVEIRRQWQEKVYQQLAAITEIKKVEVLGKSFTVYPGMFAPNWQDSVLLAKAVQQEVKESDLVLDMGTGTGIQAIFAADKALAVTAVDMNMQCLECTRHNVIDYGLEQKVDVFESDLFSNVRESFDLITYNPPFRWFKPRDMLERGEVDENYQSLSAFFKSAKKHLRLNGRILLVFSDSGDIRYLERLIKNFRYNPEVLALERKDGWEYEVYRLSAK